jgi:hypothetical protein
MGLQVWHMTVWFQFHQQWCHLGGLTCLGTPFSWVILIISSSHTKIHLILCCMFFNEQCWKVEWLEGGVIKSTSLLTWLLESIFSPNGGMLCKSLCLVWFRLPYYESKASPGFGSALLMEMLLIVLLQISVHLQLATNGKISVLSKRTEVFLQIQNPKWTERTPF